MRFRRRRLFDDEEEKVAVLYLEEMPSQEKELVFLKYLPD